ncbi:MAG: hypothetical protein ACRC1K_07415 [Planctomycetia bacterium]
MTIALGPHSINGQSRAANLSAGTLISRSGEPSSSVPTMRKHRCVSAPSSRTISAAKFANATNVSFPSASVRVMPIRPSTTA